MRINLPCLVRVFRAELIVSGLEKSVLFFNEHQVQSFQVGRELAEAARWAIEELRVRRLQDLRKHLGGDPLLGFPQSFPRSRRLIVLYGWDVGVLFQEPACRMQNSLFWELVPDLPLFALAFALDGRRPGSPRRSTELFLRHDRH